MGQSVEEYFKQNLLSGFTRKGERQTREYNNLDVGIALGKISGQDKIFQIILKAYYYAPNSKKKILYCNINELIEGITYIVKISEKLCFSVRYIAEKNKELSETLNSLQITISKACSKEDFEITERESFSEYFHPEDDLWGDFMASLKADIDPFVKAMYPKFKKKKGDRPFTVGGPAL